MTKNWDIFPKGQPSGEALANFSCYRLYEKSAIAGYGVLSGCVVSRSSASAVAVASGTFTVAGVKKTFAGGSLTSISAAAAGKHRYDLVYIDGADDTLKLAAGTEDTPTSATDFLENYVPRPAGPTDTDWIVLAVIRVTESGIENTNFGTNSYATGSVANMRLGTPFGVDGTTLQVVDGVASVKTAYVKADGTVPLTANWDVGAYKITANQLESDVAAGTPPLVVASDTVIPNLNASKLEGNAASAFAVAAKGVTNGDSHDHVGGDGAAIVAAATRFSATARVLGRKTASAGAGEECTVTEVLDLLGTAERGDVLYRGASAWAFLPHGTAGQVLTTGGNGADPSWADAAGGVTFWTDMPGTPTRVSDTQFTITGNYFKAFAKGTILQWLETATFNTAMVESASYSASNTTINIVGDSLTAGFTDMKYCIHKAIRLRLPVVPGTLAVADNPSGVYEYMPWDAIKLSVDAFVGTAGTTNATTGHVNDDASAINSDFSIASAETSDLGTPCTNPTTVIAAGSKLSIDITGVSTTAPVDLYVYLWCYPESWRYME